MIGTCSRKVNAGTREPAAARLGLPVEVARGCHPSDAEVVAREVHHLFHVGFREEAAAGPDGDVSAAGVIDSLETNACHDMASDPAIESSVSSGRER